MTRTNTATLTKIKHIAWHVPQREVTNDDLLKDFPNLKIKELTRLTGVEKRHIAAADETSADLAVKAAEKLFDENAIDKSQIDFIIFCTSGGDYITPASACVIQDRLGLPQHCGAFDFNQGCTGYLYGMALADSLIKAGNAGNVLLLTGETIHRVIHPKDPNTLALFGDGASATLLEKSDENHIGRFFFGTDGSRYDQIIVRHGRERYPLPESAEPDYTDDFGNVKNHAKLYMNGGTVFNFTLEKAPLLFKQLLQHEHLTAADIDHFVFHQANRIVLETLGKKLHIPAEKIVIELTETGNTVSSSIPLSLKKAMDKGIIKKGETVMIAGFGVGLSWGGSIIKV
jgi:3-oxoacyl-[acyl-carrier-protein] synthase-3